MACSVTQVAGGSGEGQQPPRPSLGQMRPSSCHLAGSSWEVGVPPTHTHTQPLPLAQMAKQQEGGKTDGGGLERWRVDFVWAHSHWHHMQALCSVAPHHTCTDHGLTHLPAPVGSPVSCKERPHLASPPSAFPPTLFGPLGSPLPGKPSFLGCSSPYTTLVYPCLMVCPVLT